MCKEPECREAIRDIKQRLNKLESFINGNGRPGLLERIAALERGVQTQTWLLRAVATACLGIILKQWFG